jgi:hypothetical protein
MRRRSDVAVRTAIVEREREREREQRGEGERRREAMGN